MEGPHGGPCVAVEPATAVQMDVAITALQRLMQQRQEQPAVLQTDRGSCFLGAEGAAHRAVPGRLTLWLWGLGIAHRVLPPAKPWRNGAVERLNGAIEASWHGEADGLPALLAVWNYGKPRAATTPYGDRAGFDLARVWAGLAGVRVARRVDPQGKLSLWDRPLRVGVALAGRTVVVTFDAAQRRVVVRNQHETVLGERSLPWLTADWIWDGDPVAEQASDPAGTSTDG